MTCGRRRTTSSARGCSRRWCAATTSRLPAVEERGAVGMDPRSRSQEMSKSQGNTVTPMHLLEQYGGRCGCATGRRAGARTDTAFDEGQMKIGRKLAIKLLNASRFALGRGSRRERGSPRRSIRRCSRSSRIWSTGDDCVRGLRLRAQPRAHRGVLLALHRRLSRAHQGARVRCPRDGPADSAKLALRVALENCCCCSPDPSYVTEEVWRLVARGLGPQRAVAGVCALRAHAKDGRGSRSMSQGPCSARFGVRDRAKATRGRGRVDERRRHGRSTRGARHRGPRCRDAGRVRTMRPRG